METKIKKKVSQRVMAAIVEEEERLLSSVLAVVTKSGKGITWVDYDQELLQLRDALAEEKLPDDQARILEQMDRLAALAETRARHVEGNVDRRSPYFAHLKMQLESGQQRDILLGKHAFLDQGLRIVDWRDAPISQVFYRYRENDFFEEEIAGRELCGQVLARRTVTVVDGRLVRINCPQGVFLHTADGWHEVEDQDMMLSGGAGSATRPDTAHPVLGGGGTHELRADKRLPELAALLDQAQFELITAADSGLVVISGSAGSGKTTVGLHRMAYLSFQNPQRYRPRRMLVLVYNQALARYIERVLPALGVEGVRVATLQDWAGELCRRHFPELTQERSQSTPAVVVRFKTHQMLIPMLEQAAVRAPHGIDPASFFDDLLTNRQWIADFVAQNAPGAFSSNEIDEIHHWCTQQHFVRAEGTADEEDEPPAYDEADDMILLRLHQLLRGPLLFSRGHKLSYDHILVDEAEDFSPLELQVVLQLAREGSVSLAGDIVQRLSVHDFSDWSEVLAAIGQQHVKISPLQVSYRCTQQIMDFAQSVLGGQSQTEPGPASRTGESVELFRCGNQGAAMTFLGDALDDLVRREPLASVAILAPTRMQAQQAFSALSRNDRLPVRLVLEQDFSFGPALEVSDVTQTKGLEFDYVVLIDPDRVSYPDTSNSRRLMHIGATRAIHQLWLIGGSPPSSILPDWLSQRLAG